MRQLTVRDVIPLDDYVARREAIRTAARAARAARRVQVGDRVSLAFENRETVLFQIQEMIRVESITDRAKIAEEVETYNDLVAGPNELRATFFVEITDRGRIKDDLDSLVGLETSGLFLDIGGQRIAAEFEPGHAREDRISAVHFVRFALTQEQVDVLEAPDAMSAVVIEHPGYSAVGPLDTSTRQALVSDLRQDAAIEI